MSILNKLMGNFSEGKSRIPVYASVVALGLALTTCGTPAPADTYKLNNKFKENWNNVTDKAVSYQDDVLTVTLDYSMKGGQVDWARRGKEGFAQRWQVQSKNHTPAGTTGWYTFSYKVAED